MVILHHSPHHFFRPDPHLPLEDRPNPACKWVNYIYYILYIYIYYIYILYMCVCGYENQLAIITVTGNPSYAIDLL